jgi:hypothetical protein
MNMKFGKNWFTGPFDPETLWQKISAGLALLVLVLVVLCLRQRTDRAGLESQVKELSRLNASQRKTIRQVGQELSRVRSSMSDMIARMDQLLSVSREQTELVQALPQKVVETADKTLVHTGDGSTNTTVNTITRTLNADLNSDGIVEWKDFEIFSKYWGQDGSVPADLDQDNHVTWNDFQIFTSQWLKTENWYQEKQNG